MKITLDFNDSEVKEKLSALEWRVGNLLPAMELLGDFFVEKTRENIKNSVDWAGRPLAPNSPTTLLFKRGTKPLIDSGAMQEHISSSITGNRSVKIAANEVQSAVMQFGARKGEFGTNSRGAPIPWGDIPARPFFPDDEAAIENATEILMRYLKEEL